MPKPILPLLAAASMLTACASGPPPTGELPIRPPVREMQPPAPMPAPPDTGTPEALLAAHVAAMRTAHRWRSQLEALQAWVAATLGRPND